MAIESAVCVLKGQNTTRLSSRMRFTSWLLVVVALSGTILGINYKLVIGSGAPHWDGEDFFAPAFSYVADHARAGRLMLWNPLVSGGSPDFAEPELGAASPVTIGLGLIFGGSESGFRAYWLFIWLLGPIGIVLLARHLGLSPAGAFVIAVGFAFSGFYTGHAEHISSLYAGSFLPWIVWRIDAAARFKRLEYAAEAGFLWGISALGGYPQLTILSGGFVILWVVGRVIMDDGEFFAGDTGASRSRNGLAWFGLAIGVFIVVGVIILSPTYFGYFSETFGFSDRVGQRPRDVVITSQALEYGALATFSSPYLAMLKLEGSPSMWPITDVSMASIYVGGSAFMLSVIGAAVGRSRWRWWLLGLGIFFFLCALGFQTPVRGLLYDLIVPTRYFRNAALFRFYAMFCVLLLAVIGLREVERSISDYDEISQRVVLTGVCVGVLALISFTYVISRYGRGGELRLACIHLAIAWTGFCLSALIANRFGRRAFYAVLIMACLADADLSARLTQRCILDTGVARERWNRINKEHDPALSLGPSGFDRSLYPAPWLGPQGIARNNRNVPLRASTFVNYAAMSNRYQDDFGVRPILAAMSTGADRIWFTETPISIPPTGDTYNAFVHRIEELQQPVLLVHSMKDMRYIYQAGGTASASLLAETRTAPPATRVPTTVLQYSPNHLKMEVVAPSAGWIMVTERWAPGWRAWVNGSRTDVYASDFIFRAIKVPLGRSQIEFEYSPRYWKILIAASWVLIIVILCWRAVALTRKLELGTP